MNFVYNTEPEDQKVTNLEAEHAVIKNAEIKKDIATKPKFSVLVTVFLVGALSFAVALSYNNFAQALINRYSFDNGNGIKATLINLILFTAAATAVLYLLWKRDPKVIGSAIL